MKDWPTDPMRQHGRFIAAFCDDLFDMCVNGGSGTPRADRVVAINRQINKPASDAVPLASAQHAPAFDAGGSKGGEE